MSLIIHMDTDQARNMAQTLRQNAEASREKGQTLRRLILTLPWESRSSEDYRSDFSSLANRLDTKCQECYDMSLQMDREINEWEEVDRQGKTGFQAIGKQVKESSIVVSMMASPHTNLYNIHDIPSQLYQKGGNCVLYGLLHLAHMHGIELTPSQVDALLKKYRPWWLPESAGIPTIWIDDIMKDLGLKPVHEGFNFIQATESDMRSGAEGWTYDISPMRDKLVQHIKDGEPVYVITDSEIFGYPNGGGGHAYNVVGANVDNQGNLLSVTVDTNWSDPKVMTIDGGDFLRDWAQKGCQMVTV